MFSRLGVCCGSVGTLRILLTRKELFFVCSPVFKSTEVSSSLSTDLQGKRHSLHTLFSLSLQSEVISIHCSIGQSHVPV